MREKKYIFFIGFSFCLFLFLLFLIVQTIFDIQKNSKEYLSYKEKLFLLKEKINYLQKFEKEYQVNKNKIAEIEALFLKDKEPRELVDFRMFLQEIASSSEVDFSLSSFQNKKDAFLFQISGRGGYHQVIKFLKKIENAPYLIKILRFFLKAEGGRDLTPEFSFKMEIKVLKK